MWEEEDCHFFLTKTDKDSRGLCKTLTRSFRPTSPFFVSDLNMWDTKSHFKSQASSWCGTASVSGSGFLSTASSSLSGGFRETGPGVRRWQSLSSLSPGGAPRPISPSPGAGLRAAVEDSGCRRAELVQRLRQAHERLDTQTNQLKSRDRQLHQSASTAQLLDMKHKQLAEAVSVLEHEKAESEIAQVEECRQRGRLQEKILQLERDMMKVRSTLDKGNINQPSVEKIASRTLPVSQEGFYREGMQKSDQELCELREALRVAGKRVNKLEEERIHALQQLQTSKEAQKTLASQIDEVKQRHSHTMQSHTEVQEQLSEAQSKLGQACLEKEHLRNQALILEENIKDLKATLSGALSENDCLIQEKAELYQKVKSLQLEKPQQGREGFTEEVCELTDQRVEGESYNNKQDQKMKELMSLREVNEKLTSELEMATQKLEVSQEQLLTAEKVIGTNQIKAFHAERTQSIGEKEELMRKNNEFGHADDEMTAICHKLRESCDALKLEKQKLQDRCLCLESEVLEKNVELHLRLEEYEKLEVERTQSMEKLRAVASHCNEKWQNAALSLLSTQRELEELKQKGAGNKHQYADSWLAAEVQRLQEQRQRDLEEIKSLLQCKGKMEMELNKAKKPSDLLLRVELDACKQELELERSRSQTLLQRFKGKGRGNETVLTLDKGMVTDMLPEMSPTSNLFCQKPSDFNSPTDSSQLKETVSGDTGLADVTAQLEESTKRANQMQWEKEQVIQRLQTLRLHLGKNEEPSLENKIDTPVCPVNIDPNTQRRMVAEQLKKLFKERKELGYPPTAVQTVGCSQPDMEPKSDVLKSQRSRQQERLREWEWQQRGGLEPVSEEEEVEDWPQGDEGEEKEVAQHKEELHNNISQMTSRSLVSNLKEKTENLLRAKIRFLQPKLDFRKDLQETSTQDGIFEARLVDIGSPDEDEEKEEGK